LSRKIYSLLLVDRGLFMGGLLGGLVMPDRSSSHEEEMRERISSVEYVTTASSMTTAVVSA